ncbi:MAG TPA: cytochrome P450 [Acidimicrobiales bacterium]|nr:cytochrome P450 [Acidimicrobiales bacterium]
MAGYDIVDYFTDPSLVEDPLPYFEHLRALGPVTRLPHHGVVAVTGYEEASELWRRPEAFSSCISVTGPFPGIPEAVEGDDANDVIERHRAGLPMGEYLITQDPPTHDALRGLLMRLLTPRRLQESEDAIVRLADRQLDRVLDRPSFEVQGEFAQPYALLVIAELLGVPEDEHPTFTHQLGERDPLAFLSDTFSAYVEDRRRAPRDDVLTSLATATYPDGTVPEVLDVVRTATFLFAAGQDTTARLITAALRILGDDHALQDRLRAEPERIPDFVEEVLRLDGPVKTVSRLARVTTSLGGVDIPAGTTVAVFPHAANRDPERFEAPGELRLDRPNAKEHLAFGRGIHACPGGPLARVEARIALERLLARTSSIDISEAEHGPPGARRYRYVPTYILRGITALHLEVTL